MACRIGLPVVGLVGRRRGEPALSHEQRVGHARSVDGGGFTHRKQCVGQRATGKLVTCPRGCEIVVVARTTHFDERTMFRPDGTVPTPWWQLPPSAAGDASRLVLLGQDHHGAEMRWFTEVQAWRGDTKPITVESFEGVVRNWEDRPRGPERQNDLRFCAILVLPPDGPTELYVDTRARCNLDALGRDATRCARVGREFGFDSEWDQLPDGSWTTGLGTGKVVAADLADGRGGRVPVDPSDRF